MACIVSLTALDAAPNDCALTAPLSMTWEFTASAPLPGACWEVSYVVDVAEHKHPLPLGVTPRTDYAAGPCAASFACDGIDVASVAPSWLNNIGLLKLVLRDAAGEEVAVASMLTQITKTADGYLRRFISPL